MPLLVVIPDFPFTEPSVWTGLYCLLFYLILLLCNYKKAVIGYGRMHTTRFYRRWMLFLLSFFIITHCLKGDFFHLMEKVHDYVLVEGYYNYGENVYPIIGDFVNNNYFLFRVIVWGGSFLLFLLTTKRMGLNSYNGAMLLIITHTITFSYARATASMAVYFLGLSFLCNPIRNKYVGYIIGVFLIVSSVFFHRTAVVMVLLTIMLFVPMNKWTISIFVAGFFFVSGFFKEYFELIAYSAEIDDTVADKLQRYSERSLGAGGVARIASIFDYASFLIPTYFCFVTLFFRSKSVVIPSRFFRLGKVSVGIVSISVMFYFLGPTFVTFFYRILYMSMIPLTLTLCFLWNNRLISKNQMLLCVLPGVIYQLFQYSYSIYLSGLGIK